MSESILAVTVGIFPCSSCGQMIYSNAKKCRFCSATFDSREAAHGVEVQGQVNTAYNQAKMLRNGAGAMWTFFLLGLLPFSPLGWGFTGLFFVIPVWLVYWQVKFGRLQTTDSDYKRAKRDRLIAFALWVPALALEVLSIVLFLALR